MFQDWKNDKEGDFGEFYGEVINEPVTKQWYSSKTILASIVSSGAVIVGFFGFDFSMNNQEQVVQAVLSATSVIGSMVAIYGRISAKQGIE